MVLCTSSPVVIQGLGIRENRRMALSAALFYIRSLSLGRTSSFLGYIFEKSINKDVIFNNLVQMKEGPERKKNALNLSDRVFEELSALQFFNHI